MKECSDSKWESIDIFFFNKKAIEGHRIAIERARSSLSRYLLAILNYWLLKKLKHMRNIT